MEHYRSTFATTALAVLGLVTAAHVLHPGNYEPTTRRARQAAPVATAWVDPPGEPARYTGLPVIVAMNVGAPLWTVAAADAAPVEARKVERRAARRPHTDGRTRQALLDRGGEGVNSADAAQAETGSRVDPIGDLIHSLDIGREG